MKLFYKSYGETGEVIFILHGIFGMLDNWHNIARVLGENYRVFTIDARNHGNSPHSSEMSYDLMADDVIELAKELGIAEFILMGHSMGGKTAMRCALKHPEYISKLIVVDIAPKAYKPGHLTYFNAFGEIDWQNMASRKEIDEALSRYESDPGVRLFLAKNIERNEAGGFAVKSNMPAIKEAYAEITGQFPMTGLFSNPTLFICGDRSRYLESSDKPVILEHFPKAVFTEVENAGHWVHADNPAGFIDTVIGFLNQA